MVKSIIKRSIDDEFVKVEVTTTSFDQVYGILSLAMDQAEINDENAQILLALVDTFLLLCYKWLVSPYINNEDKVKIRQKQPSLIELRFNLFSFMQSKEKTPTTPKIDLHLPRTSDERRADQLQRIGSNSAYIAKDKLSPPIDHIFRKDVSPKILVNQADREQPIVKLQLPQTRDRRRADQLERIGYLNALAVTS